MSLIKRARARWTNRELFVWLLISITCICFFTAMVIGNNWLLIPGCITFIIASYFIYVKFPRERAKRINDHVREAQADIDSKSLVAEVEEYLRLYRDEENNNGPD